MCVNKVIDSVGDLAGGVIGGQLGQALGLGKQPKVQVQAPPPQPTRQDSKAPDASATIDRVQQSQSGMSGGIANTLYTDPQGVSDEDLRLGRKTLLGR
ncbi:hypothetical protein ACINWC323_2673 [Acinetobacter sp. WC-323]|uniref:hypothetical protein n=1 Tax=Acinetobacter sp. WC-323 TaxID=903918 RepID=UPI00029E9092|nr:hypothetical protein [Acinetobacter sp. WC-323]EKU56699.1 hypothetical protein ACINWC323_2673 [Acinetobacter sp. WC-323]